MTQLQRRRNGLTKEDYLRQQQRAVAVYASKPEYSISSGLVELAAGVGLAALTVVAGEKIYDDINTIYAKDFAVSAAKYASVAIPLVTGAISAAFLSSGVTNLYKSLKNPSKK